MGIQNQNTYTTKSVKLAGILLQQKWSSYGNNKNDQVSSNFAAVETVKLVAIMLQQNCC